jgi:hypothetical protein
MSSFDYYKRKDTGSMIPSLKPGSNWFYIVVLPGLQNMVAADTLKLFKTKNHWVYLNGLYRVATGTTGAASADIGITGAGQGIAAAIPIDQDGITDQWVRMDNGGNTAADDNVPVAITADGYVFFECLEASVTDGEIDLLFEFMIPNTEVGSMTSNEG